MDFFEAQARAKKRTSRLVLLFMLAVTGTVVAAYFATVFLLAGVSDQGGAHPRLDRHGAPAPEAMALWQPKLFGLVAMGTLTVVGLASLFKWSQFSSGGSAVAESVGGRRVKPDATDVNERRLLNVVEEMAIASGVPVPAVYVMDDEPAINAFAAGLTTSDAAVAVTRGTLEKLTRDELQGVIGHEFSHILNGDMRLNVRLAALVFGILVLGLVGRGILWSLRGARVRSRGSKDSGGVIAAIMAVGLVLLIIGYIGYFFGRMIQAAVSRQREYLADAAAVQFTRNPEGLTGALKKIGGYALGSSMTSSKSGAIGHFFFAQCFRSSFGGLWATHPPLEKRIRAIDPRFDGAYHEPPQVVDVKRQSFVAAGLAPAAPARKVAVAAVAAIGTVGPEQIAHAQRLLEATPQRLREAAHRPDEATILLYGLLLDENPSIRGHQRSLVGDRAGAESLRRLDEWEAALRAVPPAQKLPLLQLALPAIRSLEPTAREPFLATLDELVHADGRVSPFEFAMQKLLIRTLALGRNPGQGVVQIHSFHAVVREIAVVLSVLARAATGDEPGAQEAFAAGAGQLKLIEGQMSFLTGAEGDLAALDSALDKLAGASGPIKQRTLLACAHTVSADGRLLVAEAELLRAVAAVLDCPMPPLGAAA